MITERVRRLLEGERAHYETRPHREVFTAQEVAASSHISGRRVAKVLIVAVTERPPIA